MGRIADKYRQTEFHFEAAESQHRFFHKSKLIGLPDSVAEAQHTVGDALAHLVRLHIFGVKVHRVEITGEGAELDDIGFGDGAAARFRSEEHTSELQSPCNL